MATDNTPFSIDTAPEVFFSDATTTKAVAYAVQTEKARKLGPRLYTKTMAGDEAGIVRRNWAAIAAGYFPGAVITGRTALDPRPDGGDGSVFLTAPSVVRPRNVELPGLRLRVEPGPGQRDGDLPFMGRDLSMASRARAFMSNLRPSRTRGGGSRRTLTRSELEDALEEYGRLDDTALNRLRDEARYLAEPLDYAQEFAELDALVGTLLGARDSKLSSARAKASAAGLPYDPVRIDRFTELARTLLTKGLPAQAANDDDISVLSFYESYFSNYIEGTEFTVNEARDIVFAGVVPAQRPEDAHDVLGTYQLVVDNFQRARIPSDADDLISILQSQHKAMMSGRPEIGPGDFKKANNQVGGREFVDRRLVEGTLRQAHLLYESLPAGFARAVFAMFLVAEVHPFADGNGRTARLLMNSELSAVGQQRIIVTTRRRGDYLAALRGMTNQLNIEAFLAVLIALQRETASVDFSTLDAAQAQLEAASAFRDPDLDPPAPDGRLDVANSPPRR